MAQWGFSSVRQQNEDLKPQDAGTELRSKDITILSTLNWFECLLVYPALHRVTQGLLGESSMLPTLI